MYLRYLVDNIYFPYNDKVIRKKEQLYDRTKKNGINYGWRKRN